jgi:hypothetical protein
VGKGELHGDWPRDNSRLQPIRNGAVLCLHVETGELVACDFTTDSGAWIATERGDFALVGQAISRYGEPNGQYVIGAKIDDDGTVPGVDPRALSGTRSPEIDDDTRQDLRAFGFTGRVSVAAGEELVACYIVETLGSAKNATGVQLQHFCTLPVWTGSSPHPDGAQQVDTGPGPTYAYIGRGAALNDINGREADRNGQYLKPTTPDSCYTHVAWYNGYEVPAAKRPATYGYPTKVSPTSQIVWRVVASMIQIGSPLRGWG